MPFPCSERDCTKLATFGEERSGRAQFCPRHSWAGMKKVTTNKCAHAGCLKHPIFGEKGSRRAAFCGKHAEAGMVDVCNRRCAHRGCLKQPSFGYKRSKKAIFCVAHAEAGMEDVISRKCTSEGCSKRATFGEEGGTRAIFCAAHVEPGMVDVANRKCGHWGCSKRPSFGKKGTRRAEFCASHAGAGMESVVGRRCSHEGCSRRPSFGEKGSKKAEFCAEHATPGTVRFLPRPRRGKMPSDDSRGRLCQLRANDETGRAAAVVPAAAENKRRMDSVRETGGTLEVRGSQASRPSQGEQAAPATGQTRQGQVYKTPTGDSPSGKRRRVPTCEPGVSGAPALALIVQEPHPISPTRTTLSEAVTRVAVKSTETITPAGSPEVVSTLLPLAGAAASSLRKTPSRAVGKPAPILSWATAASEGSGTEDAMVKTAPATAREEAGKWQSKEVAEMKSVEQARPDGVEQVGGAVGQSFFYGTDVILKSECR